MEKARLVMTSYTLSFDWVRLAVLAEGVERFLQSAFSYSLEGYWIPLLKFFMFQMPSTSSDWLLSHFKISSILAVTLFTFTIEIIIKTRLTSCYFTAGFQKCSGVRENSTYKTRLTHRVQTFFFLFQILLFETTNYSRLHTSLAVISTFNVFLIVR